MKPEDLLLHAFYDPSLVGIKEVSNLPLLRYEGPQGGSYAFSSGGKGLILLSSFSVGQLIPRRTPTEQALRYNSGKLQWHLVDMELLEPMVKVLEFGAKKYAAHNWKKGLPVVEILDSLQRHLNSFSSGEDTDPESKLPHIGHMMCNLMFLQYVMQYKKEEFDNRYVDTTKRKYEDISNTLQED